MLHPDYKNIGDIETRTIEGCSELIKALCKVQRFGWFNYNPFKPSKVNLKRVMNGIEDVDRSIKELKLKIIDLI